MSSTTLSAAKILVVDDEPSIVDSVATVLRCEGFEVDVADTGRRALQKAEDQVFDLIVLDEWGFPVSPTLRSHHTS